MTYCSFKNSLGGTPLTRLEYISQLAEANVYVKQERCNPSGSVKDRVAWYMVKDAIDRGILTPGSDKVSIIEPTSGNTGVGLAAVGAALHIPVILVMPESMSIERRKIMSVYGAKLLLTPGPAGMKGAIERASNIVKDDPEHYYMPMQFENPANVKAHYETTGPEIAEALDGVRIDHIAAGVGTGGTLTGMARYLKTINPEMKVYAVEPLTSPVIGQALRGEPIKPGPHGIQGIGAGFVPKNLDLVLLDDAIGIETQVAIEFARVLLEKEAVSTGISGGANIAAVLELKRRGILKPGETVVTVIPDGVDKYLSTALCPQA